MVDNILDMRYFREFLPEIRSRGLDLELFYEVKANLTREQLRQLSDAGVRSIQPGIESFSSAILALMRKGTTALQNVQLLKWCREFAIRPMWNLLYGFPREDPAEYAAMADFVASLHHLQPPEACGPVRLDRFSPMYLEADSFGLLNVRPYPAYELVYHLPQDELARLAYFFDFDFDDGRHPRAYTAELRDAVSLWRGRFGGFGLVYADDGEDLGIFDYREGRRRRLLSGPAREIYLYCEENRPKDRILRLAAELGWTEYEAELLLEDLVAERLMATADGRYLGLAVRRGPQTVEAEPVAFDGEGAQNRPTLLLTGERS
jgi:ribosomal peptide maturation radical SAM protein 1